MSTEIVERRAAYRLLPVATDSFGLRSAADAVLQYGGLAVGVFFSVVLLALAYGLFASPVYKADSMLQIDSRSPPPNWAAATATPDRGADNPRALVAGEIEVLGSREVLLPAIAAAGADVQLGWARRWGYVPVGRHHGVQAVELSLPADWHDRGLTLAVELGRFSLLDGDDRRLAFGPLGQAVEFELGSGRGRVLVQAAPDLPATRIGVRQLSAVQAHEDVLRRLRMFEPSRESGVVRLSFEDGQPRRAAALLNALVQGYLDYTLRRKTEETAKALRFLDTQLPVAQARLQVAEEALSTFQREQGVAPGGSEADALLRQRTDLERQRTDLSVKRDMLSQTLTSAHPELAGVLRQIGTVEGALGRLGGEVQRLPERQRDVSRLQREVQAEQQLYGAMLTHAQQLRALGSGWQASARQLDRAAVPVEPLRPRLGALLSMAAGAGLLLALGAALAARSLQPAVVSAQELQSPSVPQTLAIIPQSRAQQRLMEGRVNEAVVEDLGTHWLVVRAAPDDPAAEALRSVHLSILLREGSMATKVIMMTAPSHGSGKAFVAANLAALLAEGHKRVLLIEADLRNPRLHKFLGMDEYAPGLSDLLAGRLELDEVIHTHPTLEMDMLLQGVNGTKAASMLLSRSFAAALEVLRERYDHIVVNAPPMLPSRDALLVGRLSDFALMVVRAEHSRLHETRVGLRRLEQAGVRVEGLLLNGVKRARLNQPVLT